MSERRGGLPQAVGRKRTPDMLTPEQREMYTKGIEAVNNGDTRAGLFFLEGLYLAEPDPILTSFYAVCVAKERRDMERAVELCDQAMEDDPGNSIHHLNLGRVYIAGGMKREAIKVFRNGLLYGRNPVISRELELLGWRNLPVIPSLGREHFFNRILGKVLSKLGFK
jgi:predicted Zn-dependent protease